MALDPTYDLSSGERSADGGELQQGCCVSIHEVRAQRCGRLGASPPPLAAEPGLPGFGHFIDWPKSETSDFGWRVREGACTQIRASLPPPHPSPASAPQAGEGGASGTGVVSFSAQGACNSCQAAGNYTASTATTPGTALMAPAICGETLKRPGSLTSTSVPCPSISTSATSPSALSWGERPSSRLATLSTGASPRRKTRSPFESLAAAWSSGSTIWMRARTSSPCTSAESVSSTAAPGSSRSRNCCSPSEKTTAS